ncbi:hypothetical protein G6F68_020951 [Rhizopus microsporus]|nr:hypothetical protein G6F68_020951 [Rhizopus microsporus]
MGSRTTPEDRRPLPAVAGRFAGRGAYRDGAPGPRQRLGPVHRHRAEPRGRDRAPEGRRPPDGDPLPAPYSRATGVCSVRGRRRRDPGFGHVGGTRHEPANASRS